MRKFLSKQKGFTLIELLVVIGILAVLLAIVLIAINPAKQFAQANDTQRSSDVNAILNAVHQYMADNAGVPPAGIGTIGQPIGYLYGNRVDICDDLVPEYLAALPVDPQSSLNGDLGSDPITDCTPTDELDEPIPYDTGYWIFVSGTDSRITASVAGEVRPVISVTR